MIHSPIKVEKVTVCLLLDSENHLRLMSIQLVQEPFCSCAQGGLAELAAEDSMSLLKSSRIQKEVTHGHDLLEC